MKSVSYSWLYDSGGCRLMDGEFLGHNVTRLECVR